jgi:hypothetical protein
MAVVELQDLSELRRRLVHTMQWVQFGRIEQLTVIDGEPVLTSETRIIRTIKFGRTTPTERPVAGQSFALKQDVIAFLDLLTEMRRGIVVSIDVANGLPLKAEVVESPRD